MTSEKFIELVEQYERFVFTICYQLVRDYQEAQNLAQDTFVSAFGHIDRVSEENLKAWLARIASNKAKDFLKSAYRRKVSVSEDMSELDIVRSEQSPERLYIDDEGAGAILFFLEEKSVDEIAQELGRPKKTVQTQLYRARSKLQKILMEEMKT